jgi:hypothetical protein
MDDIDLNNSVFLEQKPQEILNIIESLQVYRNNFVKPKYSDLIDNQIKKIGKQLELQNVDIYVKDNEPDFKIGDKVKYNKNEVIIIGVSNNDNFLKVVKAENNELKIIEVPINLLK